MHSRIVIEAIDRLLQEGQLSQRQIAERLGVSRGTVNAIANGSRALHGKEAFAKGAVDDPFLPAHRCPKCGYYVHLPCLVCRTRVYRRAQRLLQSLGSQQPLSPLRQPVRLCRRHGRSRVA